MLRRSFLQIAGIGASAGLSGLRLSAKPLGETGAADVTPRGSAENVILVFLTGAPSHVDTFDLKVGGWTPSDFEPTQFGNFTLSAKLFPQLGAQYDKFSLLRCIEGDEAVHQRAQYVIQTGHTFNPVFSKEQPHVGSLVAYELEARRKASDILPGFVAINGVSGVQGPGLLPSTYAALKFEANGGLSGLAHPSGQAVFDQRFAALLKTDTDRSMLASRGAAISDFHHFYTLGEQMMYEPDVEDALSVTDEELQRYGNSSVGRGCAMAVKLLAKNRGTHMVQIAHGSWDHHYSIYSTAGNDNLYNRCAELDPALASMLADLAQAPGVRGGSLLDETLVVVTGEFGRTPGDLTRNAGRDHYQYVWSSLVAGGGIRGNQVFGATDPYGYGAIDRFWSKDRGITPYDLQATMLSSLGIDWTKEIQETPSGRAYEYTPKYNGVAGYYTDIVEMFS
ncbi:MAG: DUF1501 domain-containing protein [Acidobacteria bacterium]|nr:DUF1501 domain-containing protein [Acidobacteriota bacterium]MCB9396331.1 DUF1501 domain-containing protein [Acidobacteriota bacterium]